MDLSSALTAVGTSTTQNLGNIEKAIIEIIDLRDREAVLLEAIKIAAGGGLAGGLGGGLPDAPSMNNSLLSDYVSDVIGVGMSDEVADVYFAKLAKKKKYYTVKFNPSSLRLSGHSGGRASTLDFDDKSDNEATYRAVDTAISMSVNLLFDSMDTKDAFMSDKLDMSPTGLLTGAADLGLTMGKKKVRRTVQREVEGFIAALRNENTRLITFNWGQMSYSGVLRRVNAEYTMFNVTGEPVRAMVNLSVMCADATQWKNSLAVWQERYKKSFQGGSESFVKNSQKLGNLLNL